jgi:hypothetical protein
MQVGQQQKRAVVSCRLMGLMALPVAASRAIARIERDVGYGGDGEKAFVMQEWHWRFLWRVRGPFH